MAKLTYTGPSVDDTEEVTRPLIMDLIRQPNTLILSVLPPTALSRILTKFRSVVDATTDMSSQEGPRLARAADVTGNRIVAAVTKCDLVPPEERRFVSLHPS